MISGQVKKSEIDENGNIKVEIEFTLTDGSKTTGYTRYNAFNFSRDKLEKDVKQHCETLMKKVYSLKTNQELLATKIDDISYECTSVVIPEIKDKDGNIIQASITIDDK